MSQEPFISLSSLESDLRNRIEGEVRELEGRRSRLERDARAADEFVRRVSSILPGVSPAAVFPSLTASARELRELRELRDVRELRELRELPVRMAPPPEQGHLPLSRPSRATSLPGLAAALAVAVSIAALLASTGHRVAIASAHASDLAPPAATAPARVASCTDDAGDPPKRTSTPSPSTTTTAITAARGPASGGGGGGTANATKIAGMGGRARAIPEPSPKVAAPPTATPSAASLQAADAGPKLEDAARTASMLREQLSTTLH